MEDEIMSLMDAGQYALAIEKLRAERQLASSPSQIIDCALLEAMALRSSGRIAEALFLLDEMMRVADGATLPSILHEKATCLQLTDPIEALKLLESVRFDRASLAFDPTVKLRISGTKGVILSNLGKYQEAKALLIAAESGFPAVEILKYHLGICLFEEKNFESALAKWHQAAKLTGETDPLRWQIYYSIASCNLTLRNIHAAQAAIHQCESSNQKWAKPEKLAELVRQVSKVQ